MMAMIDLLRGCEASSVVPIDLTDSYVFDFTEDNEALADVDVHDATMLARYVDEKLAEENAEAGVGGYDEDRMLYRESPHFKNRSLHIGLDIWTDAGTPVQAPLAGTIHSMGDNDNERDYGPTVVVEHEVDGVTFYTLYGHLHEDVLDERHAGDDLAQGERFARIGSYPDNGGWPPHLHFQVITAMLGWEGDFPGVVAPGEREEWLRRCPDPNVLLDPLDRPTADHGM